MDTSFGDRSIPNYLLIFDIIELGILIPGFLQHLD